MQATGFPEGQEMGLLQNAAAKGLQRITETH